MANTLSEGLAHFIMSIVHYHPVQLYINIITVQKLHISELQNKQYKILPLHLGPSGPITSESEESVTLLKDV